MPLRLSYMQLARLGGAAADASTDLENFKLSQAARVSAKKRLSEILKRPGKAVIGINVNCGELSFARRWKPENFAKVADYFAGNGYNVLLFGSPSERNYVEKSFEYIGKDKLKQGNIHNIAGIFSFEEVLAVLQTCDAFLTNDSGLMNLAYAQNAKVIALYGPCAPVVYHMSGENNSVLYKKTYCSPCVHIFDEPPCSSAVCMDNISPEEAIEAVERQLKNGSAANADDKEECIMVNKEHDYIMGTLRIQP
jgi:heptosyltransferase-2